MLQLQHYLRELTIIKCLHLSSAFLFPVHDIVFSMLPFPPPITPDSAFQKDVKYCIILWLEDVNVFSYACLGKYATIFPF